MKDNALAGHCFRQSSYTCKLTANINWIKVLEAIKYITKLIRAFECLTIDSKVSVSAAGKLATTSKANNTSNISVLTLLQKDS